MNIIDRHYLGLVEYDYVVVSETSESIFNAMVPELDTINKPTPINFEQMIQELKDS